MIPGYAAHTHAVLTLLHRLRPQIEEALEHSGRLQTFDTLAHKLCVGELYALCREDAMLVVELIAGAEGKTLHVFIAAGNMDSVLDIDATDLSRAARSLGAKQITMIGRLGWQRVLDKRGWQQAAVHMRRPVEDEQSIRRGVVQDHDQDRVPGLVRGSAEERSGDQVQPGIAWISDVPRPDRRGTNAAPASGITEY